MVKQEYVVHGDKLFRVLNGEEFECTKEELIEVILKQDKNKAELSDDYLAKIGNVMKEAASVTVDYRYEVAKVVLNALIGNSNLRGIASSRDANGNYTNTSVSEEIQHIVKQSFKIVDEFLRQGEFK